MDFTPPAETRELIFGWEGTAPRLADFTFEPGSCENNDASNAPQPLTSCKLASLSLVP